MTRISPGKVLLTATSLVPTFGGCFFDWTRTRIYNRNCPPHAKFYNAQTTNAGLRSAAPAPRAAASLGKEADG